MAKVRDYAKLSRDIKDVIGEENITSAAHCATRLRLVLKESPSAETTAQISSMPGVIQVMENGGQYQIVIGTHAQAGRPDRRRFLAGHRHLWRPLGCHADGPGQL